MTVCGRCARYGSGDWDPRQVLLPMQRSRPAQPRRPRNDLEAAETLELVEKYGELIRKKRQKMKISVEDFARMISEKESVVKKLEQEELMPSSKLITKIRRALNIELLERGEAPSRMQMATKASGARTLGDIMKLTQTDKDKDEE